MKKKYKFQNPGRTIKEMLALVTEKFPANNAFKKAVSKKTKKQTYSLKKLKANSKKQIFY